MKHHFFRFFDHLLVVWFFGYMLRGMEDFADKKSTRGVWSSALLKSVDEASCSDWFVIYGSCSEVTSSAVFDTDISITRLSHKTSNVEFWKGRLAHSCQQSSLDFRGRVVFQKHKFDNRTLLFGTEEGDSGAKWSGFCFGVYFDVLLVASLINVSKLVQFSFLFLFRKRDNY